MLGLPYGPYYQPGLIAQNTLNVNLEFRVSFVPRMTVNA